jgi:hypothetical protein
LKEKKSATAEPHGCEQKERRKYCILPIISVENSRSNDASKNKSNVSSTQQTHTPHDAKTSAAQRKAQTKKNIVGSSSNV